MRYRVKHSRKTISISSIKKSSIKEDPNLTILFNEQLKEYKKTRKKNRELRVLRECEKAKGFMEKLEKKKIRRIEKELIKRIK